MRSPEILAPAGSVGSLYDGLRFADAVYAGCRHFSARAFAENPSVEELKKALTFAHLRGKKIYLAVNTLLQPEEFDTLYSMVRPLYEYGLDACIVQDMGVLDYIHEYFPDMPIHASTQMTLFSGAEAELLKPFGVTRYVPARELTIQEIRRAREETDLEIEVFVHGALCYCYSGQCLMSYAIGGRSGNRGMCAQPCRLPYRLSLPGDRSLPENAVLTAGSFLSARDICTLADIPDLVDAGIDSFKIEGRMKSREYSAYMGYLYRKYTDFYLEYGRERFQKLREDPESDLWQDFRRCQDIYNRGGFSRGFLFEKSKADMVCVNKSGHFGTLVGEVKETDGRAGDKRARFYALHDIHPQDILEFREPDGAQAYSYTVKYPSEKGSLVTARVGKSHIFAGQSVYRMRNARLLDCIREKIAQPDEKIPLIGKFVGKMGTACQFLVSGRGVSVTVRGAVVERAKSRPLGAADIRSRLSMLGGTDYVFSDLSVEMDPEGFLPLGSLKKLRRDAVAVWEEKAAPRRQMRVAKPSPTVQRDEGEIALPSCMVSVSTLSQARIVRDAAKEDILLHADLTDIPGQEWPELASVLAGGHCALSLPQILRGRSREVFEAEWDKWGESLRQLSLDAVVINSFASLLFARKQWPDGLYLAESNLYMENHRARLVYRNWGIYPAPETVCGRKKVMVTEGCVSCTIGRCGEKSRIGIRTPRGDEFVVVNHCPYCYNTIYTKDSVRERKRTKEFVAAAEGKRLVFTLENEEEIRRGMKEWNLS